MHKQCGIGVVVAPESPRKVLGVEALLGLVKILSTIKFRSKTHEVFFDKGIFKSDTNGKRHAAEMPHSCQPCNFHFEQDSVQVLGLQVVDLVAHTSAMMQLGRTRSLEKNGQGLHKFWLQPRA